MDGIGKTALAIEYAHTRRDGYALAWWVDASSEQSIHDGLVALTTYLNPYSAESTPKYASLWAWGCLQAYPGWLLILDAAPTPS